MTRRQAARWIEAYLAAWRSNAPADIELLFPPDAVYFTAPHPMHQLLRKPWMRTSAKKSSTNFELTAFSEVRIQDPA